MCTFNFFEDWDVILSLLGTEYVIHEETRGAKNHRLFNSVDTGYLYQTAFPLQQPMIPASWTKGELYPAVRRPVNAKQSGRLWTLRRPADG
jgi:hypothetical protein